MKKNEDNIVHIRAVVPLEEPIKKKSYKAYLKLFIAIGCVLAVFIAVCVYFYVQALTYNGIEVIKSYSSVSVANSQCEAFGSGVIRYGKDGVSYLDNEGEALWNYSYEISNPMIEANSVTAAIADVGGNLIVVMNEDGVKGEIETVLPIEKISVSEQGIVAALVRDGSTPQVICYDAAGNILVEHKTSLSGTGYPTGVALSLDGTVLLVTYLQISEEGFTSSYSYYYFGDSTIVTASQVANGEKENTIIPEAKFIDDEISVMISTDGIEIYTGLVEPELTCEIPIEEEIQSVFYGDGVVGLILKEDSGSTNKIVVYNGLGEILVAQEYIGEYTSVDIIANQIILYEGYNCLIYSMQDVLKYEGEMGMNISCIYPMWGIGRYIIVGDEGMEEIRLVR